MGDQQRHPQSFADGEAARWRRDRAAPRPRSCRRQLASIARRDEEAGIVAQHGAQIGGPGEADRAAIAIAGCASRPRSRHSRHRSAHDADPARIDDAFAGQPVDAVVDIVDHAAAQLAVAALDEAAAIAGRAAEIGLQHGIAAAGEELDLGIEGPAVAQERAAMRQHDQRQAALAAAGRQGQIGRNGEAVAAAVADRPDRREAVGRSAGVGAGEDLHAPRRLVEDIIGAGIVGRAREDQDRGCRRGCG